MASSSSRGKWFWVQLGLISLLTIKLLVAGAWFYLGPMTKTASAQEKKQEKAVGKEGSSAATAPKEKGKNLGSGLDKPMSPDKLSKVQTEIIRQLKTREQQLDAREEELNRRASELASLQKNLDKKLASLEQLKKDLAAQHKKDDKEKAAQLVKLVKVYQNMKPAAAAAVMEKLDLATTVEILRNMRGREAGKIMANVTPELASKITKLLSDRPKPVQSPNGQKPKKQ